MKRVLPLLALCLLFLSCSKTQTPQDQQPTPTPKEESPLEKALGDELLSPPDSVNQRKVIRQLILDYLRTEHPEWQIQGMALSRYEGDPGYYTGVDVVADGKPKIVQLRVWFLVKDDGQTYWKVGTP